MLQFDSTSPRDTLQTTRFMLQRINDLLRAEFPEACPAITTVHDSVLRVRVGDGDGETIKKGIID